MHDIFVPQTTVSWKLRLAVIDDVPVTVPVYVTVQDPTDAALTLHLPELPEVRIVG